MLVVAGLQGVFIVSVAVGEGHRAEDPPLDEEGERAVDRPPGEARAPPAQVEDQRLHVEVPGPPRHRP